MIVKITDVDDDVEILFHDHLTDEIREKCLSLNEFWRVLNKLNKKQNESDRIKKVIYFGNEVIGYAENSSFKRYLINQTQHLRYVTWSFGSQSGGAKIHFPSSLYSVLVSAREITSIEAFMYLKWEGLFTKLYKYAMPNMLTQNQICIGAANTEIKESLIQTLEDIIYAPYSHINLSNVKGFCNTIDFFKYLEKNQIEKKYLYTTNLKLKDLVEEV